MPYCYSLIRFVPDPARGEAINIGAIAGDDDGRDWDLRLVSNYRRAKAIDAEGVFPAALAFTATLQEHVSAVDRLAVGSTTEPMSARLLDALSTDMRNVLQVSRPSPLVADSAEGALDLVFEELLVEPEARRFAFAKKHPALKAIRAAYASHGLAGKTVATARVESGPYETTFDFAVHDERVVQLTQCWSFQLPNQAELAEQVRAWAWTVHELRSHGGSLVLHDARLPIREDLSVGVVYIPPLESQPDAAFREASAAFAELDAEAVTTDDADALSTRAEELLGVGSE
jgi:Protein of unknown function (DUF3037)